MHHVRDCPNEEGKLSQKHAPGGEGDGAAVGETREGPRGVRLRPWEPHKEIAVHRRKKYHAPVGKCVPEGSIDLQRQAEAIQAVHEEGAARQEAEDNNYPARIAWAVSPAELP